MDRRCGTAHRDRTAETRLAARARSSCRDSRAGAHGAGWQLAGFNLALFAPVLVGAPLAFVVDYVLRPPNARSAGASLRVALAIAALMFCAVLATLLEPRAAIALGVIAGALASMRLTRSPLATT